MWPSRREVWDDMDETCRNYAAVAHAIRQFEPLTMLVRPQDRAPAHDLLGSDIALLDHPIDDSWARDAGPSFVSNGNGARAAVSFEFNAWGETYAPLTVTTRRHRQSPGRPECLNLSLAWSPRAAG